MKKKINTNILQLVGLGALVFFAYTAYKNRDSIQSKLYDNFGLGSGGGGDSAVPDTATADNSHSDSGILNTLRDNYGQTENYGAKQQQQLQPLQPLQQQQQQEQQSARFPSAFSPKINARNRRNINIGSLNNNEDLKSLRNYMRSGDVIPEINTALDKIRNNKGYSHVVRTSSTGDTAQATIDYIVHRQSADRLADTLSPNSYYYGTPRPATNRVWKNNARTPKTTTTTKSKPTAPSPKISSSKSRSILRNYENYKSRQQATPASEAQRASRVNRPARTPQQQSRPKTTLSQKSRDILKKYDKHRSQRNTR